jgi:hypothetical protein
VPSVFVPSFRNAVKRYYRQKTPRPADLICGRRAIIAESGVESRSPEAPGGMQPTPPTKPTKFCLKCFYPLDGLDTWRDAVLQHVFGCFTHKILGWLVLYNIKVLTLFEIWK